MNEHPTYEEWKKMMTYHRITEEDRIDLINWLNAQGFDGKPGPANWLRAMVADWAEATGQPTEEPEEGTPYGYDDYEQWAWRAMMTDTGPCPTCGTDEPRINGHAYIECLGAEVSS